jgi:hypothetical protein
MWHRSAFHLSDFAKILLIVAVLATAGATHMYENQMDENRNVLRIEHFTPNEMTDTLEWLDRYYASLAGLQRPDGLVTNGRIEFDAVSQWLFRHYLDARSRGATPQAARASVENAIRATPEWQKKHR